MAMAAVRALAVVLALGWATANVRPVPAGSQAVMLRFGAVASVQQSGMVVALPPPFAKIVLLPGPARRSVLKSGTAAGPYLTRDGGLILLDAAIEWRIADVASYCVARQQVTAALRTILLSASVAAAASHPLDDFLASRADGTPAQFALRAALVALMNARLAALARGGAGLGVEVTGADVTAALPPSAQPDLDARPRIEPNLAAARSDAARTRQQAEQARDARLSEAHASAAERVAGARASIATIVALTGRMDAASRANALDAMYRERIGPILRQAGSVSAVDAKSVSRLILPGAQ